MKHQHGLRLWLGFLCLYLLTIHFVSDESRAQSKLNSNCKVGDHSIAEYERLNPAQQIEFVERYRQKYSSVWEQALDALRTSHGDLPFRVIGRLKSVKSIQEKIIRKRYRCFSELTDVAGTRLIVPNYAALPLVTKKIESQFLIREKHDLIGDEEKTGYRAMHYLALVDGRIVEIQILTQRGTIWAEASHELVYKGPFSDNQAVISYLYRLSEGVFLLDSGFSGQFPEVPEMLPAEAKEVLKKAVANMKDVGNRSVLNLTSSYSQMLGDISAHDFFALDEFGARSFTSTTLPKP